MLAVIVAAVVAFWLGVEPVPLTVICKQPPCKQTRIDFIIQ